MSAATRIFGRATACMPRGPSVTAYRRCSMGLPRQTLNVESVLATTDNALGQPNRVFRRETPRTAGDHENDVMNALSWGLDVSTNRAKTAAVAIDWSIPGEARVVDVRHPLPATDIAPLIAAHKTSRWAVDVPFGWPDLFVDLMADRHHGPLPARALPAAAAWEKWRTREVAQRRTDRFLTDDPRIRTRPLPASFQLLGATAAMWVLVEAQLVSLGVPVDRAGLDGRVCETYPSAALAAWGLGRAKKTWSELQANFAFLTADDNLRGRLASDDVCDAVVCALVARARDLELTIRPPADELAAAQREGWIHVSCEPSGMLVETG